MIAIVTPSEVRHGDRDSWSCCCLGLSAAPARALAGAACDVRPRLTRAWGVRDLDRHEGRGGALAGADLRLARQVPPSEADGAFALCDWVATAADVLTPVYEDLKAAALGSAVIHTDDMIVPVQDRERTQTRDGRLWGVSVQGQHGFDPVHLRERGCQYDSRRIAHLGRQNRYQRRRRLPPQGLI
jgi:Transposase IS66 family